MSLGIISFEFINFVVIEQLQSINLWLSTNHFEYYCFKYFFLLQSFSSFFRTLMTCSVKLSNIFSYVLETLSFFLLISCLFFILGNNYWSVFNIINSSIISILLLSSSSEILLQILEYSVSKYSCVSFYSLYFSELKSLYLSQVYLTLSQSYHS